jgi:hypothetical protein
MKKIFLSFFLILFSIASLAADLRSLESVFRENINSFYVPRMCGENIKRLVKEAERRKIDLSNSYVLKIEGAGFLETSGFYTRGAANDRAMLGYFHFVLVADGHVFDFDLDEVLVLKLEDYIRLQFTPPYEPFYVFGMEFNAAKQLPWWTVSRFELRSYTTYYPEKTWVKKMNEFINIEKVLKRPRVR